MDTLMDNIYMVSLGGLSLAILLGLIRLFRGPTVVDRMLAFDLVAVCGVGVIAVLSMLKDTTDFVELILVYTLLGFLSTVALTRFLHLTAERANREAERGKRRES